MDCKEAILAISAEIDDALPEAEARALHDHLETCPQCRALRTELLAIHDACGALDAEPPAQLMTGVMDRLPPQERTKPAGKVIPWKRWAAMAAAVVIIAVGAFNLPRNSSKTAELAGGALAGGGSAPAGGEAPMMAADFAPAKESMALFSAQEPGSPENAGEDSTALTDDAALFDENGAADPDAEGDPPYVTGPAVCVNSSPTPLPSPDSGAQYLQYPVRTDDARQDTKAADNGPEKKALTSFSAAREIDPFGETPGDPSADRLFSFPEDLDDETHAELPFGAEEETAVPADPPEAVAEVALLPSLYRGILTLQSAREELLTRWPSWVREDGARCYLIPASQFDDLCDALIGGGLSYSLQTEGADLSPTSRYGLVVILSDPALAE